MSALCQNRIRRREFPQDVDSGPARSDAKGVACTDVSSHQLRRHAAAHGLDEGRAGAVHRDQHVGLEHLQLVDRLIDITLWRGDEMKSAQHGVQLRDA